MPVWSRLKIYNSVFALALLEGVLMMFLPLASYLVPAGTARDAVYSLTYFLSLGIPALIGHLLYPSEKPAARRVASGPVVTFACLGVITVAAYINAIVISPFVASGAIVNTQASMEADNLTELLLLILSTAVIPPIAEELFFRGFVLRRLLPIGNKTAIVVSSLIFAMFHSNVAQFIYAFAAGLAFGAVTVMTGRLRYAVIIHAINNLIAVLFVPISAVIEEDILWRLSMSFDTALILVGLASVLFIIFIRAKDRAGKKDPRRYSLPPSPEGENEAPYRAVSPVAILYILFVLFQTAMINLPLF